MKAPDKINDTITKDLMDYLYKSKVEYLAKVTSPRTHSHTYYIPEDAVLRTTAKDEIVIEFDTETRAEGLYRCRRALINLDNAGYSFFAYDHKSRSFHIHIYNIEGLAKLPYEVRMKYKKLFLEKYAKTADMAMTKDHQLIALEYAPHFKHGNVKELVGFEYNYKPNYIEEDLLQEAKDKAIVIHSNRKYDSKEMYDNKWIIDWLTDERMPKGRVNNLILKNIAIVAYKANIDPIPIIHKVTKLYDRKAGRSLKNWLKWLDSKEDPYVGIGELMNYCQDLGIDFRERRKEYIENTHKDILVF